MRLLEDIDQLLLEAIANAPRKLGPYLDMRLRHFKKLKKMGDEIAHGRLELDESLIRSFLRDAEAEGLISSRIDTEAVSEAAYYAKKLASGYNSKVEDAITWIEYSQEALELDQNLKMTLGNVKEDCEEILEQIEKRGMDEILKIDFSRLFRRRGYLYDSWGKEMEGFEKGLTHVRDFIGRLRKVCKETAKSLGEKLRVKSDHWGGGYKKPEHEDVEVLYHASVNAKELLVDGFDDRQDKGDSMGLGGSQGNLISFTSDLYIAKEIARSLKEVVGIAKGVYGVKDVLDWARDDGLLDTVKRKYDELLGDIAREMYKKANPDAFGIISGLKRLQDGEVDRQEALKRLYTRKTAFELYRYYLTFNEDRYNPVYMMWGSIEDYLKRLSRVNPKSVGVIAAKIDMSKVEDYKPAEREYRVPPEGVLDVTKVIR